MSMTFLQQIGVLPALMITLGGVLLLSSAEEGKEQRRLLLYLLLVSVLLLLALFVVIQLTPPQDNRPFWQVSTVLMPALIGVLALIVLHGKQLFAMNRGAQLLAMLLAAGLIGMLARHWNTPFELAYRILPGVLALVLGWAVGRRFQKTTVFLAFVLLVALLGFNLLTGTPISEPPPRWLGMLFYATFLAVPGLIVVGAAVLLTSSLDSGGDRPALPPMILALVLLGYLAYSIFWASVWDHTSDGLGGLALSQPSGLVAVGAGMAMAMTLNGRRRAIGLLFATLVPLLLFQSFEMGWRVSYHDLTEARADRIAQALSAHYQREGVYPPTLEALTPRQLRRVPQPVELKGETWCYQGGDDFYRLGAFSREFFSMPVTLQLYAAEGEPDSDWACAEQLEMMKERYYSPLEDPAAMQPTLPTPLPPSQIAQGGQVIAPLLGEKNMVWGSWSPDSAYFLLGQRDESGGVMFSFLDGKTGELCTAEGTYSFSLFSVNLRQHYAWLPSGQLLLIDESGRMVTLDPCTPGVQPVPQESADPFTEITAQDRTNGRLLFKSATEYWIFDGRTLAWQLIPGVTPNPYDAHWDNAAWQPDGETVAISRLNGRDAGDGSTLHLIAGDTGELLRSLSLEAATDQSAARVDWLTPHELLLGSSGILQILDLSADPPQSTDVLAEIFGLDLNIPNEVWGHGWQVDWASGQYILTVQANHPRDHAFYLYRSSTGTVEVYDENNHLLVFFPDGQMEQWTKPGTESNLDEFTIIGLGGEELPPPLVIEGHTPRDYPQVNMAYLAESAHLAVASSQGISLHALPDGKGVNFWTLEGQGFHPFLLPAPDGSALVAVRDQGGVYWIPLR